MRRIVVTLFAICTFGANNLHPAHADALSRATAAYSSGDYVRAVGALSSPALRGNARAQGLLGCMYENATRERPRKEIPLHRAGSA